MKKVFIVLSCILIVGCSSAGNIKNITEGKKVTNASVVSEEVVSDLDGLKLESGVGRIKLSWNSIKDDNVASIQIMQKIEDEKSKKITVDIGKTEYIVNTDTQDKYTFTVKVISKKGAYSKGVILKGSAILDTLIVKADEYIDIDLTTVKFLFKTNKGAKVDFFLGTDKDALKLEKREEGYDFAKGMKITGLEPGKQYFYKIRSISNGVSLESPVQKFIKGDWKRTSEKAEWARKAIFYEIFVRSFFDSDKNGIGDFKGIKAKLDYLKELGVDALWLMPSNSSPSYHGYDVVDYYNTNKDYGTNEDFEDFLKSAHEKGIKVIMDLVVNHSGIDNNWFKEASKGENNPYRNYFVWADKFDQKNELGPWDQKVWHDDKSGTYYGVFYYGMPDMNLRNKAVREEMKKVAKFWLDKGVDGFRLDAAKHIDDKDREVSLAWWDDFNSYVKAINPSAFLVGEVWDENPDNVAPFLGPLDSSFNFKMSTDIVAATRGDKGDIFKVLDKMKESYKKVTNNYIDTTFLRNHDMNRTASELNKDVNKQKLAFAMLFTLPGTPFLYYGEEIGQTGTKPDETIREPMDWYSAAKGEGMPTWESLSFNKPNDGISVEEEEKNPDSLLNYIKKLIKIRKENTAFFTGEYKEIETNDKGLLAYEVTSGDEKYVIYHNLKKDSKMVTINKDGIKEIKELIEGRDISNSIELNGFKSVVLKIKQ